MIFGGGGGILSGVQVGNGVSPPTAVYVGSSKVWPVTKAVTRNNSWKDFNITPDGTKGYMTGYYDIDIYDLSIDDYVRDNTLIGETGSTNSLAFKPGSTLGYVSLQIPRIVVFDTTTDTAVGQFNTSYQPWRMAFSPTGDLLYALSSAADQIMVIDTVANKEIGLIATDAVMNDVAVHPTLPKLYAASSTGYLSVFDLDAGVMMDDPGIQAASLAMTGDGRLYVGTTGAVVEEVDTETDTVARTSTYIRGGRALAVTPDGSRLYSTTTGAGSSVWVGDTDNFHLLGRIAQEQGEPIVAIATNDDKVYSLSSRGLTIFRQPCAGEPV